MTTIDKLAKDLKAVREEASIIHGVRRMVCDIEIAALDVLKKYRPTSKEDERQNSQEKRLEVVQILQSCRSSLQQTQELDGGTGCDDDEDCGFGYWCDQDTHDCKPLPKP